MGEPSQTKHEVRNNPALADGNPYMNSAMKIRERGAVSGSSAHPGQTRNRLADGARDPREVAVLHVRQQPPVHRISDVASAHRAKGIDAVAGAREAADFKTPGSDYRDLSRAIQRHKTCTRYHDGGDWKFSTRAARFIGH